MPTGNGGNFRMPDTCHLDRQRLAKIETQLEALLSEVRGLREFDGPIGQMIAQMTINQQRIEEAHTRLDGHGKEIDKIRGNVWTLVWKIAAIGGGGGGLVFLLLELLLRSAPFGG